MKSKKSILAAAITGALLLSGCAQSSGAADDTTFVIGVANGQTGYLAPFDQAVLAGMKKRVEELNADGGLAGKYEASLLVEDTRSEISEQATQTQKLIDRGAKVVVLSSDSDPSIAGAQIAERNGVVSFGLPPNPAALGPHTFQMYVPERAHPTAMAQFAQEKGFSKAFLIGSTDSAYTQNGVDYFDEVFTGLGGEVVGQANYTFDQQDYASMIAEIKKSGADFIWTMMYEPSIVTFLNQLRGDGVDIPVLGDSLETPGVQAMPESLRQNLFYAAIADTNPGAPVGDYLEEIATAYGDDVASVYSIMGYDLVTALDESIRKSGSTDPGEIAKQISGLTFEGKPGTVSYAWRGSDQSQLRNAYIKTPLGGNKSEVVWQVSPDPALFPAVIGE